MRPHRGSRARILSLAVVVGVLFALAATATAQTTTTRYVDADGGVDTGDCSVETSPCATIQYAVGQAEAGDTIDVAAGDYPENFNVHQEVNLIGAQAGIDPRGGRTGDETNVLRMLVTADNVTIDGFTLEGAGNFGAEIQGVENTTVTNSIVTGNNVGVGTTPGGHTTTGFTITQNVFDANTINGVTFQSTVGTDFVVSDNEFTSNAIHDITVQGNNGITGVTVTGNTASGADTFVVVNGLGVGVSDVTVSNNNVTGTTASAILLGGDVDDIMISANNVSDSVTAVDVSDVFGEENTGVVIEGNTFDNNTTAVRISRPSGTFHEVRIDANTYTGNGTDLLRDPADHPIDIDIPENIVLPEIAGDAVVDETLTATSGTWESEFGLDFGFQWMLDGAPVSGATGDTYVIGEGDVGATISVVVTATDVEGQTATAESAATAAVEPQPTDPPADVPPAPAEDTLTPENEDPDATIENVDGGAIEPGDTIRVEMSGFESFEWVFLRLYSHPAELGWFQANGDGDLTAEVTVPLDTLTGDHKIVASGEFGSLVWAGFVVTADPLAFDDVPATHLFRGDIDWLSANRITRGCNPPANTLFCPNDSVTRGQMAAFLERGLRLHAAGDQGFTDTGDSIFTAEIDALAAADVTRGCKPPANDEF